MKALVKIGLCAGILSLTGCNREPETVVVNQPVPAPPGNKVIVRQKPATPAPKVIVVPKKTTTVTKHETNIDTTVTTPTPQAATTSKAAPTPTVRPTNTPVPRAKARPTPTPRPRISTRPTPTAKTPLPGQKTASNARPLIVNAEIVKTSKVPNPSSVPYSDALVFIKYKVVSVDQGKYDQPEILVAHWGMKGKKLLPAARYRVGQTVRLQLEPLDAHPELDRVMRNDDTEAFDLTPYWAIRAD